MRHLPSCLIALLLCWHAAGASAETTNDIKLIIDVSGSMKKNDPDNLRRPAVNLLMNLLPEHTQAGVWLFGDQIEPLVPYGPVKADFKAKAVANSELIHSRGLFTDIGGALDAAMLQRNSGGKAILLTDGMVDISPDAAINESERNRIQRELIPRLQSVSAEVHTVALSDNADKALLEAVAKSTGGLFEVARSADDLTRIFLRLFDDAVIQDRLPMEQGRFFVDSTVEEFTLLAFRQPDSTPVQIKSPDDQYYLASDHPEQVSWFQDAGFDLITIARPMEGEWRLFSDEDPQNRVTVLSDLKLDVSNLANVLHEASFPVLEVRFLQDSAVIDDPEFLGLMDLQLIVLTPSGKRIAKPLTDSVNGVYSSDLGVFAEPGRYRVMVNVDGKTFRREVVQEVEYGSPARVVFSPAERSISVRPVAVGLLSEDLRMIARLEDSDEKKRLLPMQSTGELWKVSLTDFPDGEYELSVHVKGVALTGQPLDFILDRQTIRLQPPAVEASPEQAESSDSWGIQQWSIAAAVVLGNLIFLGLMVWMFRRRGSDSAVEATEAAVSELLEEASAQDSGEATEAESDEMAASLAQAEAMREESERETLDAAEPGESAETDLDKPTEDESEAPAESAVGGMSDIVDAWDNADIEADEPPDETPEAEQAAEEDAAVTESNQAALDNDEIDETDPVESNEETLDEDQDDDLMDEFQRAVNQQLESNEEDEVPMEDIDELPGGETAAADLDDDSDNDIDDDAKDISNAEPTSDQENENSDDDPMEDGQKDASSSR